MLISSDGKVLKGSQGAIDRFIHLLSNLKEIPYHNISRNFYDEFFNWPHRCHITAHPYWPVFLPSIVSISDILNISDKAINASNKINNVNNWQQDPWHFKNEEDGYGWVRVNKDKVSWSYQIILLPEKDSMPKVSSEVHECCSDLGVKENGLKYFILSIILNIIKIFLTSISW